MKAQPASRTARTDLASVINLLTPAEFRVLVLLSQGNHSAEIAEILFTSVHTVRKHREHIIEKTGLKGQGQYALILFAVALSEVLKPFVDTLVKSKNEQSA